MNIICYNIREVKGRNQAKEIKKVLDKTKKVCYNIREEKEKNLNVTAFSKENVIKHLTKSTKYAIIIAERKKEGIK